MTLPLARAARAAPTLEEALSCGPAPCAILPDQWGLVGRVSFLRESEPLPSSQGWFAPSQRFFKSAGRGVSVVTRCRLEGSTLRPLIGMKLEALAANPPAVPSQPRPGLAGLSVPIVHALCSVLAGGSQGWDSARAPLPRSSWSSSQWGLPAALLELLPFSGSGRRADGECHQHEDAGTLPPPLPSAATLTFGLRCLTVSQPRMHRDGERPLWTSLDL